MEHLPPVDAEDPVNAPHGSLRGFHLTHPGAPGASALKTEVIPSTGEDAVSPKTPSTPEAAGDYTL
ncbi:hypothetical protein JCM10135_00620 [Stetteria hydrogenophila]